MVGTFSGTVGNARTYVRALNYLTACRLKCHDLYAKQRKNSVLSIDVFVEWNQTCQKILHVQTPLFHAEIDFYRAKSLQ